MNVTDLLIKAGANVSAEARDGWTPIFYAVINGNWSTYLYEILIILKICGRIIYKLNRKRQN